MKKIAVITAAVMAASIMMTGCGKSSKIAIQAGDVKVTQGDVALLTEAYTNRFGDFDAAKKQAIKTVQETAVDYAVYTNAGYTLSEDDLSMLRRGKANFAKSFGGTNAYKDELKKKGASEEFVEMVLAQQLYEVKLEEDAGIAEPDPDSDEVKAYFKENFRRATHVLLRTDTGEDEEFVKQRADDILKRAQNGENFDELVSNLSEDPGSQSNPDGYVFTDGDMVEEFDEAVKSIKPGEFTICKSNFGYHVIKRLALDESDPKFNEFFEQSKSTAATLKQMADTRAAINKKAEELGITLETFDDVLETIPSPTPEPTEKPTEEPKADETATEAPTTTEAPTATEAPAK